MLIAKWPLADILKKFLGLFFFFITVLPFPSCQFSLLHLSVYSLIEAPLYFSP